MFEFLLNAPELAAAFLGQAPAAAAPAPTDADLIKKAAEFMSSPRVIADTLWVLITAMLVFWMNAGFACLETGLCRRKNAVNILAKNFIVFAISSVAYWMFGFGLMFADGNPFVGMGGFLPELLSGDPAVDMSPLKGAEGYKGIFGSLNWVGIPLGAKFFFQLVFAGTAATIVSGAVAERIQFKTFLVFSFIIVGFLYAIPGHWIWGGGWLGAGGFFDFAGSTQVHSIGGWCALAGILVLGPRIGKYRQGGGVNPIPGHNMGLVAIGTFILWLGWFGFNPGSTMSADPAAISHICITTNTAGSVGAIVATLVAWAIFKKPDFTMTVNGCLAGLVAVTAPCAFVSVGGSFIIGLVAGILVVFAVQFFDKIKVDDPVGALSVHLANGLWGTIAVGLFATASAPSMGGAIDNVPGTHPAAGLFYGGGVAQLLTQLKGIGAVAAFVFPCAFAVWYVLKLTMGVRVSPEEELEGLDLGEHGMEAYPGFSKEEGREAHSAGAIAPEAVEAWAKAAGGKGAMTRR